MRHGKKCLSMALVFLLSINLLACKSNELAPETPALPPDLSGQWKQANSQSEDSYHGAIIDGDRIEIYWVADNGDTRSLYWSGSVDEPTTADEPYSWRSKNDTNRTATALLASHDETKEFTYENNQISYSASIMGTTSTIRLEKEQWAPGLKIENDIPPSDDIPEESEPTELNEYGTYPLVIAGVEFSIPDYYVENAEQSAEDAYTYYFSDKGDMAFLEVSESYHEDYTEAIFEEEGKSLTGEHLIESLGLKDAEILFAGDITIAGLRGKTVSVSGNSDGFYYQLRMDMISNPTEKKLGVIGIFQMGNLQYDYFSDYEEIIKTAKLSTSGNTGGTEPIPTSGIRPEFKQALDSYEAFFDEYIAFMERYKNSNNSSAMLTDYANYMKKYAEYMTALAEVNDGTLSAEELAYYVEVNSRITQKLLLASQ